MFPMFTEVRRSAMSFVRVAASRAGQRAAQRPFTAFGLVAGTAEFFISG